MVLLLNRVNLISLPLTKSPKYPKALDMVAMLVEPEVDVCNVVLHVLVYHLSVLYSTVPEN